MGRAVWAGGYRAAQVALFTAVALLAPKALVASVMGFTMAVSHFAAVIGAPVGGYVGDSFGWRAALDVFAAATVLALLAFLGFFRNRSDQAGSQAEAQRHRSASAYRSPIVWLLGLLFVFNTMVAGTIAFFVPSVMIQVFGMTTTDVAKTISIAFGLAIPMAIVAGMLSDRFHSYKWVLIGFNIPAMVGTLALISSDPFIFTTATVVVVSMGLATIGLIYALPTTLLPQQEWATANAIITTGASLSSYFGPQLVGLLRDLSGSFTLGWCVLAAAVLAGMVETYLLRVR